ncbi:putative ribonuclease H-like domain-containing protein [Tanacetum coccineum]
MEELLQFKLQKVWILVDLPKAKRAIGTKWVFRNKKDKRCIVIQNKARLVAQGHTQEEGIDYDEVFAPVARIKAIRLFLAYASFIGFMVYQMDVKSSFLYGRIEEEVYVCQPPGFEDPDYPDKVYKVVKSLYGLHQAPRAWDILLVHVYVDDIIFGSTKKELCTEFEKLMHDKFQMSSMGELTFFLGLQVKQKEDGIFISQDKYVAKILRKFSFTDVRTASTPMDTEKPLLKDSDGDDVYVHLYRSMIGSLMYLTSYRPDIMFTVSNLIEALWVSRDSSFDLVAYSDSDYAGASLDKKSTTGGCQFLGCRLISWQCKKQTVVATSSTKAEYVVAASSCGQGLVVQGEGSTHLLIANTHSPSSINLTHSQFHNLGEQPEQDYVVPKPRSPNQDPVADDGCFHWCGCQIIEAYDTTRIDGFLYNIVKESDRLKTDMSSQSKYGAAFTKLIKKVKKLEKIVKSSQARRRTRIVVSDDEDDLEDPSKQGRKIAKIDQDPGISLEVSTANLDVSTAEPVSTTGAAVTTASVVVSTARPTISTAKDITMAETLVYIRRSASKDKVVRIADVLDEERGKGLPLSVLELATGSSKRNVEEELDQESSKRQKTGESSELAKEPKDKEADELDDLVMLLNLVKEKFKSTEPTDGKEREIWVELKRLFEPDTDDELWKLQKNIHDLT